MERKINSFSKLLYPQIFAFGIFQTRSLRQAISEQFGMKLRKRIRLATNEEEKRYWLSNNY